MKYTKGLVVTRVTHITVASDKSSVEAMKSHCMKLARMPSTLEALRFALANNELSSSTPTPAAEKHNRGGHIYTAREREREKMTGKTRRMDASRTDVIYINVCAP